MSVNLSELGPRLVDVKRKFEETPPYGDGGASGSRVPPEYGGVGDADPLPLRYSCVNNMHFGGVINECVPGQFGEYATLAACEQACPNITLEVSAAPGGEDAAAENATRALNIARDQLMLRRNENMRWLQSVQEEAKKWRATTIAGGQNHSLVLSRDGGSVGCWGNNSYGQAPPDGDKGPFVAIAAGGHHSLGLKPDGSVKCWGYDRDGQAPSDGKRGPFAAIAAGDKHSLGLKPDGSVECWGYNGWGQQPDGQAPPDGKQGPFVAIAAGCHHSLGLKPDGSVECWGANTDGQAPTDGNRGPFVAIAAGYNHSLGLKQAGSVECWGQNFSGQCNAINAIA